MENESKMASSLGGARCILGERDVGRHSDLKGG
jgi:hypothetical protein